METHATKDITKRLDALIYIMLNKEIGKPLQPKEQVGLLDSLGFRPIEIAATLGRTQGHVNKELAHIRKSKKGKKNG